MQSKTKLVPSAKLLLAGAHLGEATNFGAKSASQIETEAALTEGFHLYVDIGLKLALSAAEDDESAAHYLRILEDFAAIADRAATDFDATILEVQGERIHLLVECSKGNEDGLKRLLSLAYAIVNASYHRLADLAGDDWRGCKASADHGRAVILISDVGGGSAVSLGTAANRPAKQLSKTQGVEAGHLAIPNELLPRQLMSGAQTGWTQVNLREPNEALLPLLDQEKQARLISFQFDAPQRKRISLGDEAFFTAYAATRSVSPVKIQGFCLRADLDGFSKQVEEAFSSGNDAILDLVERFRQLLALPNQLGNQIRARVLVLPWAGDCATIVLIPEKGNSFASSAESLPATAALAWHDLPSNLREFGQYMGGAKWSVGVAAGNENDGNEGRMLITQLIAQGRTFRVLAGWAARRSSDAYQVEGIRGGETALTEPDYNKLSTTWRRPFSEAFSPSYFKASYASLNDAKQSVIGASSQASNIKSPVGITIPHPRPYSK